MKFESIKKEPEVWANEVVNLILQDRNDSKEAVLNDIKMAGYDIKSGAEKLKKLYSILVEDSQN